MVAAGIALAGGGGMRKTTHAIATSGRAKPNVAAQCRLSKLTMLT
jgi:hypothetical protein